MADFPVGTLTEEQARLLWQDFLQRRQLIPQLQQNLPQRPTIDEPSPHRVFVANGSGGEIPPYACMEVTGTTTVGGRLLVTVGQPSSLCGEFIFNSQFKIEPGGYGWGYAWGLVKMQGVAGSYEACKRYQPIPDSWGVTEGPGPFLVYGSDLERPGVVIGRVIGDHCQARWIKFTFRPEDADDPVTVDEFFDGPDPSECGDVEVMYPLGQPLCECEVMAFFDPNTKKYQAIATQSAMMGEPEVKTIVTSVGPEDCGISVGTMSFRTFPNSCNPAEDVVGVTLGEEQQVILAISSDSCGTINYSYTTMRVFMCNYAPDVDSFAINFDGVEFVTAAAFGPQTCTGEATYTWNPTTNVWDLTTPCESGCESSPPDVVTPFPTSAYTETVPCDSPMNGQCGLNLQMGTICQDYGSGAPLPTIVHVPLPLQSLILSGEVYDNGTDAIVVERWEIDVCSFRRQPDDQIAIGICDTSSSGGSGG